MSRIEPGGFEDIKTAQSAAEADHPIFDQDWKDRVAEARVQREKILSRRKSDVLPASPSGPLRPRKTQVDTLAPEVISQEQPVVRQDVSRNATTYKLLLAFSAATGIGLGVTLGIGALALFGGADPAGDAAPVVQSADAPAPEVITAQALTPVTQAPTVPGFWQVADLSDNVTVTSSARAQLPEIAAVQYVSASGAPTEDGWTLTVPPAPALPNDLTASGSPAVLAPRFFVHAPNGLSEGKLQAYIAQFESKGLEIGSVGRESFRVSNTHLRYYSSEVAEAAKTAAAALGVEARDFSQGGLETGRIEIWVAGRPKAVASNRTSADNPIARFFGRLTQGSN